MNKTTLALVAASFLVACGTQTVGETCEEVADRFCGRLVTCDALSSADRGDCVYGMLSGCCDGPECQEDVAKPANVDRCVAAIGDVTCTSMKQWAANPSVVTVPLPALCRGVASPK